VGVQGYDTNGHFRSKRSVLLAKKKGVHYNLHYAIYTFCEMHSVHLSWNFGAVLKISLK
jgi:hypothetical protein